MQFPAFLTDNRPYLIVDGEVALQWASTIEERRKPLRGVRLLTRQDRAISTDTSFNMPKHKVAALQPAARGQEPRDRKPAERKALAGLRAPS
jgi:hypothetical protein